jgi:hypothetical protein
VNLNDDTPTLTILRSHDWPRLVSVQVSRDGRDTLLTSSPPHGAADLTWTVFGGTGWGCLTGWPADGQIEEGRFVCCSPLDENELLAMIGAHALLVAELQRGQDVPRDAREPRNPAGTRAQSRVRKRLAWQRGEPSGGGSPTPMSRITQHPSPNPEQDATP